MDLIMLPLSWIPALIVKFVISNPGELLNIYMMPSPKKVFASLLMSMGLTLGQSCQTITLTNSVPSDGSNLALNSYSYCSGTLNLTSYIKNLEYNKIVTLYYTNADNVSTIMSANQLSYKEPVPGVDGWEYWTSSNPYVYLDGITDFLNLTYQATDSGQTYVQNLNIPVNASGSPAPTSTIPAPYASPTGFSQDITEFLNPSTSSEGGIAKVNMFKNINIPGAANGTVIAAQSYSDPDYAYDWVRDSSLTMDVVQSLYNASERTPKDNYATLMFLYAVGRATEQNDPNLKTGLGEPKFNLNNTVFTGPWGRPQNDGPATAAITLMEFSNAYLAAGGSINDIRTKIYDSNNYPTQAPVLKDLLYVANNWASPSFDLWEEEEGDHFYTRMVQYRSLVMGSAFATSLDDTNTASTLSQAASALNATLSSFWDPIRSLILYEYGPVLHGKYSYKDTAVLLAIIHGTTTDSLYTYASDTVLASLLNLATTFSSLYPVASAHFDSNFEPLAPPMGRYPEDTFNGTSTSSQGNPWYLCTATAAEILYRASTAFSAQPSITITNTSVPFWNYFASPSKFTAGQILQNGTQPYSGAIAALQGWGDAFIRTIKYHTPSGGHLSEEIDRSSGVSVGAMDLTWSYGSLLTAAFARAEAMGDTSYIGKLAAVVDN